MVKMAYTPLPKLVPINTSKMCLDSLTKTTLSEVLQSDPVKRLFNQPDIVIKAIPSTVTENSASNKDTFGNRNGTTVGLNNLKRPEISIVPVKLPDEEKEDANLLPSKIEDKKSEIALLPIKQKLCGHYEPCENIVCHVAIEQCIDQDGVSPILARNIEEDEINAPVSKHCKNQYCDALSIDHNRCRRALIKLHKCDRSRVCDICGITLKRWKSRLNHRNCTRKDEYRHNNVDRVHLLKERMRERELQMLEAAKVKKNNYLDPVSGYNLTMEALRKNEELIIIPKTVPNQQHIITITSVSSTRSTGTNLSNTESVNINPQANPFKNIFGGLPFAVSPQNTIVSNMSSSEETKQQTVKQVGLSNLQDHSYVTSAPVASVPTPVIPSQNQYVQLTNTSQTNMQPITINNWIVSPSHVLTTTSVQSKPLIPVRVVPITSLITAPSLLHRTQGIPKFCIMADNLPVVPLTIPSPPPLQPMRPPATTNVPTNVVANVAANVAAIGQEQLKDPRQKKLPKKFLNKPKKKIFFCDYCSKHFSTDWYFKVHVAKHKGEKLFSCNFCNESFSNKYDVKKHTSEKHDGQEILTCNMCDYVCKSVISLKNHIKIHMAINPLNEDLKLQEQGAYKTECKVKFPVDDLYHHKTIRSVIEETLKTSMHKGALDSKNETMINKNNKNVFINEKMAQQYDCSSFKNAREEEYNNKELSAFNKDDNIKINGFSGISVKENIDSENLEETVTTTR